MTDESPPSDVATFRASVQSQIASLRDTAKWMAGGVALAASGIVAGGAIAGVGSVDSRPRLITAIAGAMVGLLSLGAILSRALDVLTARRLPLAALSDDKIVPPRERKRLESSLADLFPANAANGKQIRSFIELSQRMDEVRRECHSADEETKQRASREVDRINHALAILVPAVTFEELRYRFLSLKNRVLGCGLLVIAGLTAFVWAVNPPKAPPLLKRPTVRTIAVDKLDQAGLDKIWVSDACRGRYSIAGVVVRRYESGSDEVVTLPTDRCQESILFQVRDNRLLMPE